MGEKKPLNLNTQSCGDIISSNCVKWGGPDIPCLNLCKGDTITDVVYKAATELCEILTTLDISTYDISCFNLDGCEPEDFEALIKLLIERICALEGIDPATAGTAGCPTDCTVTVASCFFTTTPQGDTITTMDFVDYVRAIGVLLCEKCVTIQSLQTDILGLNDRISTLEQQQAAQGPAMFELVTPTYVLPATEVTVGALALELEDRFHALESAVGMPNEIFENILKWTAGISGLPQLAGMGTMGSIQGWTVELTNLAESHGNILLAIDDIRAAVLNIQAQLPSVCDDIEINLSAVMVDPNTVDIFFSGVIPQGFVECNPQGTLVTITDSAGGEISIYIPILQNFNQATGYRVDLTQTPVNGSADLTIVADSCLAETSTDTQCKCKIEYFLNNVAACPQLSLTPAEESVAFQFNHFGDAAEYDIELYDGTGSSLLQSMTQQVAGPQTVSGSFINLNANTQYRIRVVLRIGTQETECPFVTVTTLAPPCLPPNNVTATINIP